MHPRFLLAASFVTCYLLSSIGCTNHRLEEAGPATIAGSVSAPKLISGDPIDLRQSGCELPSSTVFIVRFIVHADGSTGQPGFSKGEPSECIASYVSAVVAEWLFEPSVLNGKPVDVFYHRTINSPP